MIKNQKLLYKLPVEVARTDFLQNQNLDCLFTVKYINLNNIYFYVLLWRIGFPIWICGVWDRSYYSIRNKTYGSSHRFFLRRRKMQRKLRGEFVMKKKKWNRVLAVAGRVRKRRCRNNHGVFMEHKSVWKICTIHPGTASGYQRWICSRQ